MVLPRLGKISQALLDHGLLSSQLLTVTLLFSAQDDSRMAYIPFPFHFNSPQHHLHKAGTDSSFTKV